MNNGRAIAAYWVTTFRGQLVEPELKVFDKALENTEVEDAVKAIDEVAAVGGYPPTPQRIAELAEVYRKERARKRIEEEKHAALPDSNRPVTLAQYLHDNTDMYERVVALTAENAGTKSNPIRAALATLLRQGL